jgi:hypothetical protein
MADKTTNASPAINAGTIQPGMAGPPGVGTDIG